MNAVCYPTDPSMILPFSLFCSLLEMRAKMRLNSQGFEAVRVESPNGKKAVNYWRLTDEAYRKGIQSTTRYRKQANHKRALGSDPPAPQRQRSGAKGGKATKIAAKYRGQMMLMTGQQEAAQRERLYLQPAPFHQQQLPSQMGHYVPYLRTATSLATMSPTPSHADASSFGRTVPFGCHWLHGSPLYPFVL
jgi:hypothetical protein